MSDGQDRFARRCGQRAEVRPIAQATPVISVECVSKNFRVFAKPMDRLKSAVRQRLGGWNRYRPLSFLEKAPPPLEFQALTDISFQVAKGETVGVIGRNGSGKSTLLQLICGTMSPSAGRIAVKGRVAALLELGAGFNPEFTGRDNVLMNAALWGLSRKQIDERLDDIFAFADIGNFIEQPVKTYSSGMYVRLAFAVAAHVDADVLVIDEALAVGDAFFTQKCMRYLRAFMQHGTVLFVSHDTSAVMNLCERAIWLEQGALRAIGSAKDICDAYLEAFYDEQHQAVDAQRAKETPRTVIRPPPQSLCRDQRTDFINASILRNDIELFEFRQDGIGFGLQGARIDDVTFADRAGKRLGWIVGGEIVCVQVVIQALQSLDHPIVGFVIRDRLGQNLFGDNTFLTTLTKPPVIEADEIFSARFLFRMPVLPLGDYSLSVAVANGSQAEHVVHQWLHDAIIFKSHSTSMSTGLIGIPMHEIAIERCISRSLEAFS